MDNPQTQLTTPERRELTPDQKFGSLIESLAQKELSRIASTPEGKAAVARVAIAFRAASKSAKDPGALYKCDASSVAACVVSSALYNIMPGGAYPGVYLVPKGGVLGWWLNHRGIIELARRSGYRVVAKPHFTFDEFSISYGLKPDLTHKPGKGDKTWNNLAGVYVIVYDAASGAVLDYLDVDKDDIEARRKKSQTSTVWNEWPIEMAIKTAVKYAAARGSISLDEAGRRAAEEDEDHRHVIETTAVQVAAPKQITGGAAVDDLLGGTMSDAEREKILAEEAASK